MLIQNKVKKWAYDKGIVSNGNAHAQMQKMQEEVNELFEAVEALDPDAVLNELGDVLVTCIVQAACWELDIEHALEVAYNKISKRTGTTVNGVFVKDGS